MNTTKVSNEDTARTRPEIFVQRAERLKNLCVDSVLELCIGPSFLEAQMCYEHAGINFWGNDWADPIIHDSWFIRGDALKVWHHIRTEAVVFAPPTTSDSAVLDVDMVEPRYDAFLDSVVKHRFEGVVVLVLPGLTLSSPRNRASLHRLAARGWGLGTVTISDTINAKAVVKYVEITIDLRGKVLTPGPESVG